VLDNPLIFILLRQLRAGTESPLTGNSDRIENGMPDQARTSGHERIDIGYVGGGAHVLDFAFYFNGEEDYDL
jgi:hypothetical protein